MIPVPGKLPNAALLKKASAEFRGLGPGAWGEQIGESKRILELHVGAA